MRVDMSLSVCRHVRIRRTLQKINSNNTVYSVRSRYQRLGQLGKNSLDLMQNPPRTTLQFLQGIHKIYQEFLLELLDFCWISIGNLQVRVGMCGIIFTLSNINTCNTSISQFSNCMGTLKVFMIQSDSNVYSCQGTFLIFLL